MKLNLKGIEIEVPDNAKVHVSEDGKSVKVMALPETEVVERIKVVEGPERVIERIKVIEVEKPCSRPHYDWHYTWPYYPSGTLSQIYTATGIVGQISQVCSNTVQLTQTSLDPSHNSNISYTM